MPNPTNAATLLTTSLLALAACSAPPPPGPSRAVTIAEQPAETLASRDAARHVELLHKLLRIDREAVELAEQRLAQLRSLAAAGRRPSTEVTSAEQDLLQAQRQLLEHEQELATAEQQVASAAVR